MSRSFANSGFRLVAFSIALAGLSALSVRTVQAFDTPAVASLPAPFWSSPIRTVKPGLLRDLKSGNATAVATASRELGLIADLEDDDSLELHYLEQIYGKTADPYLGLIYWNYAAESASGMGNEDWIVTAARRILAAPGQNPLLRAYAQDSLGYALYDTGKESAADAAWSALHYVRSWHVIGPFDNASLSGFDRPYGPESGIDYAKPLAGSDSTVMHWHPLAVVDRDGTVEVGESLSDGEPSVFYASTAIQSSTDGPVTLQFSAIGASKIYVNGELVFRDPVYRFATEWTTDSFAAMVKLKKGWNTVLVKLTDNDKSTADFRMRFTDATTGAALDYASRSLQADRAPAVSDRADLRAATPAVIAALKDRIFAKPDDLESRYMLAAAQRKSGDFEASAAVLRAALELAPKSALLHWSLSVTLGRDDQRDASREQRDIARSLDDHLLLAEMDAAADDKSGAKPSDRIKHIHDLLARINPHSPTLLWALADAEVDGDLKSDAFATAKRAAEAEPSASNYDHLHSWYNDKEKPALAAAILKQAKARFPYSVDLAIDSAQEAANNGEAGRAIAEYRKLLGSNNPVTKYRIALADIYIDARKFPEALAQLTQARLEQPQDADLCARLGDIRRQTGDKTGAIALYREAIRLDPSQIVLRDKLQALTGEKPVGQIVPGSDVAELIKKLPKASEYPGVSEVRILDEGRQVVYPDFAQVMYNHEITTLLDDAAVKKYQRYSLGRSSGTSTSVLETARIIKFDHKIVDCKGDSDRNAAAFPSLVPGDTIDIAWRVEDYPKGGLAGKFWSTWTFPQLEGPVRLTRYVLITPNDVALDIKSHNGAPEPTTRTSGPWQIREWKSVDLPALKPELLASGERHTEMWVDVSTVHSWADIVAWYQTLSKPRCVPDAIVRAKAEELTKDAKSDDDKIRAIVNFVSRKIEYQSSPFRLSAYVPTEGKDVLRDSYGDCKDKAALVTAMLSTVGITSHMALLSPRNEGTTPYLPSPRFSHAIAVIDTPKGPLWIDATANTMEFGPVPTPDQGVPALLIEDGVTDLTTTPTLPAERSSLSETSTDTMDSSGGLTGSYSLKGTGDLAATLRFAFNSIPQAQREIGVTQVVAQLLPGSHATKPILKGLENPDDALEMQCDFKIDNFAQAADTLLIAHIPWSPATLGDPTSALRTKGARRSDLETSGLRSRSTSTVTLTLPAGFHLKDVKPEIHAELSFGSYRFLYTVAGTTLTALREVNITPLSLDPAQIPAFVAFLETVQKLSAAPIVLEKTVTP